MKAIGTGIINLFLLPIRIIQYLFSFIARPIKFISEQIAFEKKHEIQRRKFFNAKRRSKRFNDEII